MNKQQQKNQKKTYRCTEKTDGCQQGVVGGMGEKGEGE